MIEEILIYLAGCLATYLLMCKFADDDDTWYLFFSSIIVILCSWVSFIVATIIMVGTGEIKIPIKLPKPPKIFIRFKNNKQQ